MKSLLLLVAVSSTFVVTGATAPPWKEILGPSQGKQPGAASWNVTWRTNLVRAMAEAREQNRPLFVTFRCLPCKQCSAFDKEVLEGGADLDPLLTQFITVRLTDAAEIDLRVFPVEGFADLDMSWWGWFLSPEGRVYGVFGGRDHVSDATRISKPALIASLSRVLAHHYAKMAVEPFMGKNTNSPAYLAGVRGNHIVTAVDGESPNVAGRAFLVWFIQKHEPGDRVTVTVMDGSGKPRDFSYQLPQRGQ